MRGHAARVRPAAVGTACAGLAGLRADPGGAGVNGAGGLAGLVPVAGDGAGGRQAYCWRSVICAPQQVILGGALLAWGGALGPWRSSLR